MHTPQTGRIVAQKKKKKKGRENKHANHCKTLTKSLYLTENERKIKVKTALFEDGRKIRKISERMRHTLILYNSIRY